MIPLAETPQGRDQHWIGSIHGLVSVSLLLWKAAIDGPPVVQSLSMTKGTASPAARKQLGAALRKLREESGKHISDVATARVAGATKVWRIESGHSLPTVNDVLGMCWLYDADQVTTRRLADLVLALGDTTGGWWEEHGSALPSWLHVYVGMEQTASGMQIFEPDMVHGLLQTRDYALAANFDPDDAVPNAELRMARQEAVFSRTDRFTMQVVLGAAALRRQIGGREVMTSQVEHLRTLGRSNVEVRILSDETGMHRAIHGTFNLFNFDDQEMDAVVYVPLLVGGRYVEDARQTEMYRRAFSSIWGLSTPLEEYTP